MIQQTLQERLKILGYSVLPREHSSSLGFSGLLVAMHHEPQGHEPETMQLRVQNWDGTSTVTRLHANTELHSHIATPGMIVVRSQQEREVTFFTFGGTLERNEQPSQTIFSLHSPAPTLELQPNQETIADMLADETQALFARAAARQQLSPIQLLERLAITGPETTYIAVLNSLLSHDEDTAVAYSHHNEFIEMLQEERDWYKQTKQGASLFHDLDTLLQITPASRS